MRSREKKSSLRLSMDYAINPRKVKMQSVYIFIYHIKLNAEKQPNHVGWNGKERKVMQYGSYFLLSHLHDNVFVRSDPHCLSLANQTDKSSIIFNI